MAEKVYIGKRLATLLTTVEKEQLVKHGQNKVTKTNKKSLDYKDVLERINDLDEKMEIIIDILTEERL